MLIKKYLWNLGLLLALLCIGSFSAVAMEEGEIPEKSGSPEVSQRLLPDNEEISENEAKTKIGDGADEEEVYRKKLVEELAELLSPPPKEEKISYFPATMIMKKYTEENITENLFSAIQEAIEKGDLEKATIGQEIDEDGSDIGQEQKEEEIGEDGTGQAQRKEEIWEDNEEEQALGQKEKKGGGARLLGMPDQSQKGPWDGIITTLNKLIEARVPGLTSAMVVLPQPPFSSPEIAVAVAVKKDFDQTFFDEVIVPRGLLTRLPPRHLWILPAIKGASSFSGGVLISLAMTAFSNVVFGETFKYPVGSGASYTMLVISIAFNGPVAGLIYYDLAKHIIEKPRSSFQPPSAVELQGNCAYARIFPKSAAHKVSEFLLRPFAAAYAIPVIGPWLKIQKSFLAYGIVMSVPLFIFYEEPYQKIGRKVLWELFADNFYIRSHYYKEMRKGLVAKLDSFKKAIAADINPKQKDLRQEDRDSEQGLLNEKEVKQGEEKGKLTKKIWELLKEQTKTFGKDAKNKKDILVSVQDYESISLLSLLLAQSAEAPNEPVDEGYKYYRNQNLIQEKPPGEKITYEAVKGLMWLSFVPGLQAESSAVSNVLSLWGASEPSAKALGWVAAVLFSSRLLVEQELHKKTFASWKRPFSPFPADHIGIRRAVGAKVILYSVVNAAIFTILTSWALDDIPLSEKIVFLTVTAVRYFSLFYAIGSMMYDEAITTAATRNKANPSLEQKKAHLYDLIEKAKHLIRYELTNETIDAISKDI